MYIVSSTTSPVSLNDNKQTATQTIDCGFLPAAIIFSLFLLAALLPKPAFGGGVFSTDITSLPDTFFARYDSVEDAFDQLEREQLLAALPGYTDTSAVDAVVDYRGLEMLFEFELGSSNLIFEVPSLGISELFVADTRDEAKDALVEYLKGAGFDSVNDIQRELARVSPVDPVAGNPTSLMANMVESSFSPAMDISANEFMAAPEGDELIRSAFISNPVGEAQFTTGSSFGIDLGYAQYDLDGTDVDVQTLVFDYQYQFKDPLKKIKLKLPVSMTDTEGSKSYDADLGLAFSYPLTRSWTITPGLSYGIGGSDDLGGAAAINGYSLLSSYRFAWGCCLINIGNMIGHYETGSVTLGDYEIDPGIANTVYRNGLVVYKPQLMLGLPAMMQFFFIDTRYSGDDLYTEHYYEGGFSLGLITEDDLLAEDGFNLGLTYIAADDADITGYKVNFGYRF